MTTNKYSWMQNFVKQRISAQEFQQFVDDFPQEIQGVWKHASKTLKIPESTLAEKLAETFQIDIAKLPKSRLKFPTISDEILARYHIILTKEDENKLVFASTNPFDNDMYSLINFASDKPVEFAIATPDDIDLWFAKNSDSESARIISSLPDSIKNSGVATLTRKLLVQGINDKASDIHIEPYDDFAVVRFRIDGVLSDITELPLVLYKHITQHIKAMCYMDISNSFTPQDGQKHIETTTGDVDLRISSMPTIRGEKFVIRILKSKSISTIEHQNFPAPELEKLRSLMLQQKGIIIIAGPTGSGKTTTLNSIINQIKSNEKCIVTIEDPVEYKIEGVTQINVNDDQGLTFAKALRHTLRQDPDVILVGEIRDEETAQIAIRSSLTGHFVLSTLHASDTITVLPRIEDLGITKTLIAESLTALVAQRLVRRLCPHCSEEVTAAESDLEKRFLQTQRKLPLKRARGCEQCHQLGYAGRIPIIEILEITKSLADAIRENASLKSISEKAKQQGMRTLSDVAIEQILIGNTSIEETFRVLGNSVLQANSDIA